MSDDTLKQLRSRHAGCLCSSGLSAMCHECEIDVAAAEEIERLRAAGDALVEVLRSGSDRNWDAAIDAWLEARRG